MKLADWLNTRTEDGSRRRRRDFAAAIGVTPTMVTEYAAGRMQPGKDVIARIAVVTKGDVMPNDFLTDDTVRAIAEAAQ